MIGLGTIVNTAFLISYHIPEKLQYGFHAQDRVPTHLRFWGVKKMYAIYCYVFYGLP